MLNLRNPSGGHVWVQETHHLHGVAWEARPDDICAGGLQRLAHVYTWLLLERAQEQPCKFETMSCFFWLLISLDDAVTEVVFSYTSY
jgi:hypothetical protein